MYRKLYKNFHIFAKKNLNARIDKKIIYQNGKGSDTFARLTLRVFITKKLSFKQRPPFIVHAYALLSYTFAKFDVF